MGGIGEEDWLAVGVDLAGRTEGRRGEAGEGEVSPRGGDVASLASDQEQVGVPPEDLPRQQLLFMTYGSSRQAKWVGEWCAKESQAANADRRAESGALTSPAAPSNLRAATMRVVQAPACLAQPVTQKKPFRIPFKVRLDLRYTERLQLPVKVEAIALPESSVEHLAKQQGEGALVPTQLTQQNELENATISCCIQTHDNDGVASCEKRCFEDLEFTDLRFSKSSRMSRRWILFACRLGWDMLYALYRLPTIVLSRRTDQFDKACVLLRQKNIVGSMVNSHQLQSPRAAGCPVLKDLEPGTPCIGIGDTIGTPTSDQLKVGSMAIYNSQGSIRQFIRAKYAESGLRRPLTDSDLAALDFKAGLRNTDSGFFADAHKWQEFQTWFIACLKSLKMVEHLWCPQGLMLICPFGIDREVAEYILQDRPLGTFVVRISSQPGALAISTKINVGGLSKVNHVLVDALDLKAQLLENWVLSNEWAKNLLDIHTGEYTSKWVAFAPQALTSVNSSELGSPPCMTGPLASYSPLSCSTNMEPSTPTLSIDRSVSEETSLSHTMMVSLASQPCLPQQQQQPQQPQQLQQLQQQLHQQLHQQLQQQLQHQQHRKLQQQQLQQLQQQQLQQQQLQEQQLQHLDQQQQLCRPQGRRLPCVRPYSPGDFRGLQCLAEAATVSPRQLAEVSPRHLAEVSPRQLAEVSPRQLAELSPRQLAEVSPRQLLEAPLLGKRSSSTSAGTTLLFGDHPHKRRLLGLQDGALYSMQHNLGAISQIEHCNV